MLYKKLYKSDLQDQIVHAQYIHVSLSNKISVPLKISLSITPSP